MQGIIRIVQANGLTFHTEHFGTPTNPTCLLIAGAVATGRIWRDQFCSHLADNGFFVIRYDHRDIGESSGVDWEKTPYTLSDLAKDAIGILDAYEIKQAHFIGHSMGGYVCQRIALEFPQHCLSMTAISAGPVGATAETDTPLTIEERVITGKTWGILLCHAAEAKADSMVHGIMSIWKHLSGELPFDEEMATIYTHDLLHRSQHPLRIGNNHELLMRNLEIDKYHDILQRINAPTLVIHGDCDSLCLPRNGIALAHGIPNSNFVMIPGMGHMLFHKELESKLLELVIPHMKSIERKETA